MSKQSHLIEDTRRSLQSLVQDSSLPVQIREDLASEYAEIETYLRKLERGELHIALFGRVSVGKSSLANALTGKQQFSVSPLHGETKAPQADFLPSIGGHPIVVIDTPGINEVNDFERERLALQAANSADLVIIVVDGDLCDAEYRAITQLAAANRPMLLALNKSDRYSEADLTALINAIARRVSGMIAAALVIAVSARPPEQRVLQIGADGSEYEYLRPAPVRIEGLQSAIERIVANDANSLKALSAGLYAADLSDQVARRIVSLKTEVGEKLIRNYAIGKGIAVAITPVPLADLFAAAAADIGMIVHLSKLYGLPMTRVEASSFVATVAGQLAALFGAMWGLHIASSALKGATGGLTTALTAGMQGALGYYGAYLVGRAAVRYLEYGKSWGPAGPKTVLQDLVASLDRKSILNDAREQILSRIKQR